MAGSQIETPANGASDWSDFTTQVERQRRGFMAISITNLNTDNEPEVEAGSVIEINGAIYQFTAAESITDWAGIGNSNIVYIKVVPSGTSATVAFTTTAGTWSGSKQGYYDSNDRYFGQLYKDASGNYSYKQIYGYRSDGGHPIEAVGEIVFDIVNEKPGYLLCDGSTINSTTNPEYSRLVYLLAKEAGADAGHPFYDADADEAVLPDLRGYSVRGITGASVSARDQDGNRDAGHYQDDDMLSHGHDFRYQETITEPSGPNYVGTLVLFDGYSATSTESVVDAGTGSETVMKNVALHGMIKY